MPTYTYNGATFSEEDVIAKAEEKGLDLDSYINKFGIKKEEDQITEKPGKPKPVAKKDAVATAKSTVSKSVKSLPELQSNIWGEDRSKPEFLQKIQKVSQPKVKFEKPVSVEKPKQELRTLSSYQYELEKEKEKSFSNYLKESFDSGVSTIVQSVYKAPEFLYDATTAFITDPVANLVNDIVGVERQDSSSENIMNTFGIRNIPAEALQKRIDKSNKIIQDYSVKNGIDPLTAVENGNYLGAAKLIAGGTTQSVPMMAAAMLSGGSSTALAGIAASTAISKAEQLKKEQPEMDVQTRTVNSAVSGLLEGYLGHLFTGASGAVVQKILTDKGSKVGSKIISNGLMSTLETAIEKNPMIGVLGEVAEESAVELGNQLNDINSGIRKDLDYRAITNAGIIATGMAGTNTIPIYGAKGYMKAIEYNQVKSVNKEINTLTNQLSNPYISDSDKKIISSRVNRLVDENKSIVGTSLEKIDALPLSVKNEINTINTDLDDLKSKYLGIVDNTDLPLNVQQAMGQELELQAKELYNRKSSIIEGNYIYADFNKLPEKEQTRIKTDAFNTLQEDYELRGETITPKEEEVNREAVNIYNSELKIKDLQQDISRTRIAAESLGLTEQIEIPELKTANDVITYLENNTDLDETAIENYSGSLGLFVPLKNGKEALIINQEEAAMESIVTTGQHEFLHKLVYKAVKDNPELQKKIGTDLYNHIEKYIGTEEFNNTEFKERYDGYKLDFDKTKAKVDGIIKRADQSLSQNLISQEQYTESVEKANNIIAAAEGKYLEETLPLLSESLSKGDIKYNETFFTKLGDIIRKVFQKFGLSKVNFETGKDVFNFVRDYNKSFKEGKFTKAFETLAKKGEYKGKISKTKVIPTETVIKESKGISKVEDLKQDLEDLEDQYYEGSIDEIEFENKKGNLDKKLKEAIAEEKLAKEKPVEKNITIYHGAPKGKDVTKISDKGVKFFATDKREADEYARMHSGITQEFLINSSQIIEEDIVINKIKELGLTPKNKEFEVDDASFYELIDTRFEESLSKEDITKLFNALQKDGIKAISYSDGAQVSGKYTTSIAVLDPSVVTTPKKQKEKTSSEEEDEVKEIIKSEKGTISSDKVQQIYNEKGKNGANEIIKLFKPITKRIVDKRRDAPGFDRELLTDEIETGVGGILDLITKYDPKSGVPLAAYINKYLPLRAIATSRRILDAQFTKDVTEEKAIMAEETVTEVKEKPKYKNALESKVFEPEVLKTINDKVLTVVRTLKSKVNEPISLNRTVTPIIAEIRDEIGKQVDIDVKTAMGGKKDNQLKNWLLKNKRYILENMTTTWLMGKDGQGGMPIAVQKQINGRWVNYPEWVGQKIDREKTTTDQAGRTSGAELVRRLPNVANNISDVDFLSQVLGPDGNPLRGRKESLAKAIAEESTFDIINNDLDNEGVIYDALKTNQERLGVKELDNLTNELTRQIERGNVKFSNKIIKGFEVSKEKLGNEILNARTIQEEARAINNWIASDGRSLRTLAWEVGKALKQFTTNRGLFENIILPAIKTYSKFEGLIGKDSYRIGPADKGESIYFGETKVPLWADTTKIKYNWNKYIDTINEEALKATDDLINTVNYLKDNNYTEEDFNAYIAFLRWDQRGLIRKVSKAGLTVQDMTKKQMPHLEHNAPIQNIVEKTNDFFNEKITEKELREFINKSRVNLVPDELNKVLPNYKEGKNRMHDPKVVLYLQNLINNGYKVSGLETEYESKEQFDDLVKLALEDIAKETGVKESKVINDKFNKIIGRNTGVSPVIVYSDIVAKRLGAKKGKFRFFVPPSAEDFTGLLYDFLGKGKEGEKDMEFFKRTLIDPYVQGIAAIDSAKQAIKKDYKLLRKAFPEVATKLENLTPDKDFTYDQALRVSIWSKSGIEIPGISKRDEAKLNKLVNSDPELSAFRDGLMQLGQQEKGWIDPSEYWDAHTIVSDLNNMSEKGGRKKFLEKFISNSESMFGKWEKGKLTGPNMNKIEAIYGTNFREALENSLYAMTNGTNRSYGTDKLADRWMNWVNGSTGAIMFFNTRSAILQTLGAINYLNWSDNNPLKAGIAFANQKQYWADVAYIYNSDKMKERRAGLKEDVNAAEIANATKNTKDKTGAAMAYLLKIGYTPTQIADSFAIATGGAAFYRNRINTFKEQGLSDKQAEEKAWKDFSKVTEETQQSGDAMMVSQQQRSSIGRLVLAFGNTPMQYNRLMKKSFRDLVNKRGDAKEHISKIIYYGAVQNIIFSALQNAMFALAFDKDDDEDKKRTKEEQKEYDKKKKKEQAKWVDLLNGMSDTILRGSGLTGAALSTAKNVILEYLDQEEKGYQADHAYTVIRALGISPAIGSKTSKLYSAIQTKKFEQDVINKRGWDITDNGRLSLSPNYQILGGLAAATTNVPLDRVIDKVNNVSEALNDQNQAWQRIALGLGWKSFDVGLKNEESDLIKAEAKAKRKEEGVIKAKETRERTKDSIRKLPIEERIKLKQESALKRREEKIKKRNKRKMGE